MYLLLHGPCVFYTFILFGLFCHIVLGDMKNPKPQALDCVLGAAGKPLMCALRWSCNVLSCNGQVIEFEYFHN
jgi:hypothetical protein